MPTLPGGHERLRVADYRAECNVAGPFGLERSVGFGLELLYNVGELWYCLAPCGAVGTIAYEPRK